MTTFVLTTAAISAVLLFGFIGFSVGIFGLQSSYSGFSAKWMEKVPIHNMHLWSIVTIAAAMLLVPIMIEKGNENPLQFLGFIVPVYLIVVGLTPEYETNETQRTIHTIAACICALVAFVWVFTVTNSYVMLPVCTLAVLITSLATETLKSSLIFWGEMIMFLTTYSSIFFS